MMRYMKSLELMVPPVAVVLIFGMAMWLVERHLSWMEFRHPWSNAFAIMLAIMGVVVALLGVKEFRKARTTVNPLSPGDTTSIVKSGIYRYSRNPMYAGFLLVLVAWGLYLGNTLALLLVIGFVLYMNKFQIEPEERALANQFSEDYREYVRSVRRWL